MAKKRKKRYPRDEATYNLVQENEIFIFLHYLPLAVYCVAKDESLWCGEGRPPKDLKDVLTCLSIYRYFGQSLRRTMGILRLLKKVGAIHVSVPCFKTLNNYMNNPGIKPYLDDLIRLTSNPLALLEHFFATDSTGISTSCFSSWYSIRTRKKTRKRDHIIAHVTTGTRLNAAMAVDVKSRRGGDSAILRKHVKKVAKEFDVKEWTGDSAYLSRENCDAVAQVGAEPWFRLKSNITAGSKGSFAWHRMVRGFRDRPEEAELKYHRRSNSESTLSAKKRKYGDRVKSRKDVSKVNEEMLAWVDYNFSVLSRAYYEHGIVPDFAA